MSHYQPVAWMVYTQDGQSCYVTDNPADVLPNQRALPLYTEPFPTETHHAITHCDTCGCDWLDNGLNPVGCPYCKQPADDEVVFIDGVGAWRSSIKSCRDGVQWIKVGDRVYWPLSDSDAKRLQSACCGNGSFDGPAAPLAKENIMNWIRMSDRKPTIDDADESGTVWVYDKVFADVSSVHLYRTGSPYYTHWMPKEKRPAPPAPKGEQQ